MFRYRLQALDDATTPPTWCDVAVIGDPVVGQFWRFTKDLRRGAITCSSDEIDRLMSLVRDLVDGGALRMRVLDCLEDKVVFDSGIRMPASRPH